MNEMLGYIFNKMSTSEQNTKQIVKVLKRQRTINGLMLCAIGLTTTYLYLNELSIKILNTRIEALTEEVEELKSVKGEEKCND